MRLRLQGHITALLPNHAGPLATLATLLLATPQAASLESRLAEAAADQEQLRQRCAQLEAQVSCAGS